jgi:hypothetical protein
MAIIPPPRRVLVLTITGVVIAVAMAILLKFTTSLSAQVAFAIGLLGTLITVLLRVYALLMDRFEALERSLIDSTQLRALTGMPDVERLVVDITKHFSALNASEAPHARFFWDYAMSALTEAEEHTCDAASGLVTCTQEEEIYLVREALKYTRQTVSAVAARGPSWWAKPEADAYWEAYGSAAKGDMSISRVFIVEDSLDDNMRRVLDRHHALGMETLYVSRDRVPERFRAPIVLFDNSLLHRPARSLSTGREHVSFTRNGRELVVARAHFEAITSLPDTKRWPSS